MATAKPRTPSERTTLSTLKKLDRALAREHERQVAGLRGLQPDMATVRAMQSALLALTEVRANVAGMRLDGAMRQPRKARDHLRRLAGEITQTLQALPWEHHTAQEGLIKTLDLLIAADAALLSSAPQGAAVECVHRIVVPSELLYQAHHDLFPAERMLVVAGRQAEGTTTLGAVFDVTGTSTGGHVRADPERLARALIAMDLSGAYLAAWFHSHPGNGPAATRPSAIDIGQHQDWIRDYSPHLLSAIVVRDGWVRFWGTALESDQVQVQICGVGVAREEADGCLYRLAA